ncbi:MAG TPA: toxic anion resistance protein [Dongiaceae bacterium]
MAVTETKLPALRLNLDMEAVKGALAVQPDAGDGAALERKAQDYVDVLANIQPNADAAQAEAKAAVEAMGRDLQAEAAQRSKMLRQPIKDLSARGTDGGTVGNALLDLKMKVEELDPARLDLSPGFVTRLLGMIPGVGSPLKRYFSRYESAQTVIDAIVNSLQQGREQLRRDNVTLGEDQGQMRALTRKLERQVKLGQLIDQKLSSRLGSEIPAEDARHKFVQEELLFPLRQRIMDLQQQLAVNQQGVLSLGLIMRNNEELMRGVNRAVDVTVSALQVAVTAALALANQKIVLDKINALNQTTSDLISGTAERLRNQGAEIQKQASSSMLSLEALKSAFVNINAAMDEISRYRRDALPRMAQTILEFDKLAAEGETAIRRYEAGEKARPKLMIEA